MIPKISLFVRIIQINTHTDGKDNDTVSVYVSRNKRFPLIAIYSYSIHKSWTLLTVQYI